MHYQFLFLISPLSLASASRTNLDVPSYGSGIWNDSYAVSANSHPNATKTVPFSLGAQNYTFQVNVAELAPGGAGVVDTTIQNPRVAASFYNLLWEGEDSLNDTLEQAWGLEKSELCLVFPMGPLKVQATDGYKEEDGGDCSNALGSKCMKDLAELESNTLAGICTGQWMPESCSDRFGDGGLAGSVVNYATADNGSTTPLDQRSPLEIAWYQSAIHEAGNTTFYDREIERLHVIFLSGTGWGVTPVCTRVNMTKVRKNNDAVFSGASESSRSLYLAAALALTAAAFIL